MIVALPMHGECKLRREGLRTRDAHLMEWFGELTDAPVHVISRPEPFPRVTMARLRGSEPIPGTWHMVSLQVPAVPPLHRAKRWWPRSARWLPSLPQAVDTIVGWNPFAVAHYVETHATAATVLDLLDDWSTHPNFQSIRREVERAYERAFERADVVVANSPRTVDLACRFGRDDVLLIRNGCDPERFGGDLRGDRPVTIGYAGKLGLRLDAGLVHRAAAALPECRFVLAGPVLEPHVVRDLRRLPNVVLTGDVAYSTYPALLASWDVGWVPHRVDVDHAIGGDVIKTYEYRAAGLPVFSTPIEGTAEPLDGVRVVTAHDLPGRLREFVRARPGRVEREPAALPAEVTWSFKAQQVLRAATHSS